MLLVIYRQPIVNTFAMASARQLLRRSALHAAHEKARTRKWTMTESVSP